MNKENKNERLSNFKYLILALIALFQHASFSQQISLEESMDKAVMLSPTRVQADYNNSLYRMNALNEEKGNLPSINLSGQYSYQSDVFQLPFSIPGSDNPVIPKDQYRLNLEVSQKLFDGGLVKNKKLLSQSELNLNNSNLAVTQYQVKELIKEIYFNALILQENEKILGASLKEFDNQIARAETGVKNGVLLKTELETVEIEKMNIEAQLIQANSRKQAMYAILSNWIGEKLEKTAVLARPQVSQNIENLTFERSELNVFDAQSMMLNTQKNILRSITKPKLLAFANTGVGNPNPYNLFETELSTFYMAGVRLQWNVFDWGINKRKKETLTVNQQVIASQKANFQRHVEDDQIKKRYELKEIEELLALDNKILAKQSAITRTRSTQFQKGTVSASDYLSDVNKEIRAKQNKSLHAIMQLKTKYDLLSITGNL